MDCSKAVEILPLTRDVDNSAEVALIPLPVARCPLSVTLFLGQRRTENGQRRTDNGLRLKPPRRYALPLDDRELGEELDHLAAVRVGLLVRLTQHFDLRLILVS